MLDVSSEVSLGDIELVVVEPGLVSDLLADELCVVSGWDGLIDHFFLLWVLHDVRVGELSHFYVVRENIEWQIGTFGDGNEFVLSRVLVMLGGDGVLILTVAASIKRCKWNQPLL